MYKTRKIQMVGALVLIVAATLVTLSAIGLPAPVSVDLSWSPRPDFSVLNEKAVIPITGSEAGLAQYHHSEWGTFENVQEGQAIYHQSERVLAYPAQSNEAGLAQYHRSERGGYVENQNGLAIYHESERMQPVKWILNTSKLYEFHQSEWLK